MSDAISQAYKDMREDEIRENKEKGIDISFSQMQSILEQFDELRNVVKNFGESNSVKEIFYPILTVIGEQERKLKSQTDKVRINIKL